MSDEQSNRQDSNIPLLSVMKKRGKRSSAMFSFRPTRSMSTSKSMRRPKAAPVVGKAELFEGQTATTIEKNRDEN